MRNQREAAEEAAPNLQNRHILLAEDDPAMRALLARTLRRAGFNVIEARNGYETLERLANGLMSEPPVWFDVIVSDVRMPGYDGLNILVSVQKLPIYVPVILITAFGTTATHAAAARLGAFAMLDKPFDLDDLMTLVYSATTPFADGKNES